MASFHQFIVLAFVSLVLSNCIMVVNGNEEASVEIADVWGIATIPAGKQGTKYDFYSPLVLLIEAKSKFVITFYLSRYMIIIF